MPGVGALAISILHQVTFDLSQAVSGLASGIGQRDQSEGSLGTPRGQCEGVNVKGHEGADGSDSGDGMDTPHSGRKQTGHRPGTKRTHVAGMDRTRHNPDRT